MSKKGRVIIAVKKGVYDDIGRLIAGSKDPVPTSTGEKFTASSNAGQKNCCRGVKGNGGKRNSSKGKEPRRENRDEEYLER